MTAYSNPLGSTYSSFTVVLSSVLLCFVPLCTVQMICFCAVSVLTIRPFQDFTKFDIKSSQGATAGDAGVLGMQWLCSANHCLQPERASFFCFDCCKTSLAA